MRKLALLSVFCLLILSAQCFAFEGQSREPNNVLIMSGQTIFAGGTSTFIIDLKDDNYYPILIGEPFSLQFSGVSCAGVDSTGKMLVLTGATINAAYRMSNRIPSGVTAIGLLTGSKQITSKLESTDIVTDLAHDSGNTEYTYDFFPQKARYLIIDITSGATDTITSVYIDLD